MFPLVYVKKYQKCMVHVFESVFDIIECGSMTICLQSHDKKGKEIEFKIMYMCKCLVPFLYLLF